jgi:glycosyltransferase involved in cell wall biosynthesis
LKRLIKSLLPLTWRRKLREQAVRFSVEHLHGPRNITLPNDEAAVTCVVKNGEFYLESFIQHYSKLGFQHIFFLDNGSSDDTIAIAKEYKNVSICRSNLPIQANQTFFKKYLAQNSILGGWCLDADIDEFFDYPSSDVIKLRDLLAYLENGRYTAVMTQLLDMFSDKTLSHLTTNQQEPLKQAYQYYDISDLMRVPYGNADIVKMYGSANTASNASSALLYGGIRKTLYGDDWMVNCLLTKHSLVRTEANLELFPHVHFVNRARLADISCAMMHYKFTSNALDTARQNRKGFVDIGKGYATFIDLMISQPHYQIKGSHAIKYKNVNELVESNFLFTSDEYRRYVNSLVQTTWLDSKLQVPSSMPNSNLTPAEMA